MQLDNQTLTEIIKNVMQTSTKPDYIGWTIGILGIFTGIIAIVITLRIYRKQEKLTGEFDRLRKEAVSDALRRISTYLLDGKRGIAVNLQLVEMVTGSDEEKLAVAKNMIKGEHESRVFWTDLIMREADFIRSSIPSRLYGEIQGLVYHVKLFVDNENLAVDFGSPLENLNVWRGYGREILERSDKIVSDISSLNTE